MHIAAPSRTLREDDAPGTPLTVPQAQKRRRLSYVDSLRGIAVLAVFLTHSTEVFRQVTPRGLWIDHLCFQLNLGRVGVVTFFAISGFLIPSSLHGRRLLGTARFLISRFFRLYPAFALSVLPSAATYVWISHAPLTQADVLYNFTMAPQLFGAEMANNGYWTLAVELFFYGLCAFLFAGGVLENGFVLACVCLLCFGVFYTSQGALMGGLLNPSLSEAAFFFYLHVACIFWGALCRRLWDGRRLEPLAAVMFGVFSAFWLLYMPLYGAKPLLLGPPDPTVDERLVAGYAIGLWIFVAGITLLRIELRLLSWIGKISYSLYLLHQAVVLVLYRQTTRHSHLRGWHLGIYVLLSLAASIAVAAACYYTVEAPCIALGRRLIRRLEAWVGARSLPAPAQAAREPAAE